MSNAETVNKNVPLLAIGGTNERAQVTEIKPEEWANITGTFPEKTGMQSRIWGKRIFQKSAESVYGIFQFWTPLGYGGGYYQFTGTAGFGAWTVPTTNLSIPNLPSDLPFDPDNYTLQLYPNDFSNVCGRQFSGLYTAYDKFGTGVPGTGIYYMNICNPGPGGGTASGGGQGNSSGSGGPVGPAKKCKWVTTNTDFTLILGSVVVSGTHINCSGSISTSLPGQPGPFPDPIPYISLPSTTCSSSSAPNFQYIASQSAGRAYEGYYGTWNVTKVSNISFYQATFNLSGVVGIGNFDSVFAVYSRSSSDGLGGSNVVTMEVEVFPDPITYKVYIDTSSLPGITIGATYYLGYVIQWVRNVNLTLIGFKGRITTKVCS